MRATLNIPDDLIAEVQKATGEKSKTKAITIAMQEFVRQKKIKELLALRGKIQIEDVTKELDELETKEMEDNDTRWRAR
ncbi:MAG: type II toxin-antitoxin system VapB family antitoxin [Alphaproteobacteria bacterium]|uniref:Type II toxin-antitoxin system VapB family antitoxin n=1 Tax=Candidatus Nitrobium versatile TaxID=2884831 RepID=A0A953JAI5_9BACT|nr:type II toxin-antitoxin system VapB family antitoxin [Candidatus Nitrobium versatile]